MRTQRIHFAPIVFVLLAMLACQIFSPPQEANPSDVDRNNPQTSVPGSPVNLTPENAKKPPDAKLDWFQKFANNPQGVYYSITFTSSNPSKAQFNSLFRITAFDADGNKLGEDNLHIGWIVPGQSLHSADQMYIESGAEVARLEVTAEDPGQLAAPPGGKDGPLSVDNANFFTIDNTPYVVGTIHNLTGKTLTNIDVFALAYDTDGKIVDAAHGSLSFIPAGQQTALQVGMNIKEPPARVELYPGLSSDAEFLEALTTPITVEKASALQKFDGQMIAIYILKNNAARAYAGSSYIISVYDAQGNALAATSSSEIAFMSPNSRLAKIDRISYPVGASVARLDVQVQPRPEDDWANQEAAVASNAPNPLIPEQIQYTPDVNHTEDKVTTLVKNSSNQGVDHGGVAAVLYNAAGQIVGGGETSFGFLPAGGQTQVEIRVEVKGEVAQTEIIPFYSNTPVTPSGSNAQPASPGNIQETPLPIAEAPKILSQWFAQQSDDRAWIDFAFLVNNPNQDLELLRSEYQVVVYDKAGLVLDSQTIYIDLLPAGQSMGDVEKTTVEDTDTVDRIEITITKPGQAQPSTNPQPLLSAGQVKYTHYQDWDIVSGLVNNSLNQEMTEVAVNALLFDANGQIVGAGQSFGSYFVPANGQVPVAVRATSNGIVARAEFYPFAQPMNTNLPATPGLQPLKVLAAGFRQNPQSTADVTVAFIVENPNPDQVIFGAHYVVALYDQAGALLATTSSDMRPLSYVYPGSKTAMTAQCNVSGDTQVAKVEVFIGQGQVKNTSGPNPLQGDKASYIATHFPKVTGLVVNSSGEEIKQVNVYAILYDQEGRIIGGGETTLDSIPANSQVPVELMVASSGTPARVEIYASMDTFGMNP